MIRFVSINLRQSRNTLHRCCTQHHHDVLHCNISMLSQFNRVRLKPIPQQSVNLLNSNFSQALVWRAYVH